MVLKGKPNLKKKIYSMELGEEGYIGPDSLFFDETGNAFLNPNDFYYSANHFPQEIIFEDQETEFNDYDQNSIYVDLIPIKRTGKKPEDYDIDIRGYFGIWETNLEIPEGCVQIPLNKKYPLSRRMKEIPKKTKLEILLKRAVGKEEYEKAAEIRDKLKEMN